MSCETRSNTQIKPSIKWAKSRIKTTQVSEDRCIDKHSYFAYRKDITQPVVLSLIPLPFCKRYPLAKPGHRFTHLANNPWISCHPLFGPDDLDKGRVLDGSGQALEGYFVGNCVVSE